MRWVLGLILAFATLPLHAADAPLAPGDVVIVAARDASTIQPVICRHTRYLSLANIPDAKERALWRKVLGGHLNSLSREPDVVPPHVVGEYLLRVNADDYGKTFAKVWENLANFDPYFHVNLVGGDTEKVVEVDETYDQPYGHYVGTTFVQTEVRKETRKVKKTVKVPGGGKVVAQAPWLADTPERAAAVVQLTALTQSQVPVVNADWFLFQTAIQADRGNAGYYDFLGIKDLKTYQAVVGFTKEGIDLGFLRELRESVATSAVTLQPRALLRFPTVGGSYWFSQDVRQAKDKSNPLRILNDELVFDATEQYGHLPNGLWAMGLFNAQGVRQDSAPDFIASDSTAPHNDRRVHIYLSCVRCHSDGGLKDINGWVRNVLNSPPNFLAVTDPEQLKKVRQQYLRRLEPFLDADRKHYALSLAEATGGMTPKEYSAAITTFWTVYAEDVVTVERAARELGVCTEVLIKALEEQGTFVDPVLSAFRQHPPQTIPVTTWQEAYVLAQIAVVGRDCKWADKVYRPEKKE